MCAQKYNNIGGVKPAVPWQPLGSPEGSWCLVFSLAQDEEGHYTKVTSECLDTCQRLWSADLDIAYEINNACTEIFLSVGAAYEILVEEANILKPRMRLKHCKGSHEFQSQYIEHYTPCMFSPTPGFQTCFTSGHRQRVVWHRMVRLAGYHPDEIEDYLSKEDSMKFVKKQISHGGKIRALRLRELLATHGGFRHNAVGVLGPEVQLLAEQCLADKHFVTEPELHLSAREIVMLKAQAEHMRQHGLEPVSYDNVKKVVEILEQWTATEPGNSEKFVGSMVTCFPIHAMDELEYLQRDWATYGLVATWFITGKEDETADTYTFFEESMEAQQWAMLWSPIDVVRDYFGDHIGMYVTWLELYTRALVYPAIVGTIVFFMSWGYTVDENPYFLGYSIFLCLWSAAFNIRWARRRNELQFLWGSEGVEDSAPVREQFIGMEVVNEKTGMEKIVHPSPGIRFGKLTVSAMFSMAFVAGVIIAAFAASMVRFYQAPQVCAKNDAQWPRCGRCELILTQVGNQTYAADGELIQNATALSREYDILDMYPLLCVNNEDGKNPGGTYRKWNDGWPDGTSFTDKNRWKWTSSFINVVLIQVFGAIYSAVAKKLNNWENHRTQVDYEDNLIFKEFVFQFVNNFFVLFYIGYMRQVDTSFLDLDVDAECANGSCLSELEVQVLVVFTTKSIGQSLMEVIGPKLTHMLKDSFADHAARKVHSALSMTATVALNLVPLDDGATADEREERQRAERKHEEKLALRTALRDEAAKESKMEAMSHAGSYESTFDSFAKMAIQYGYLSLFGVVFPLAPLLALLNNIFEIRVDAVYLCYHIRRPRWVAARDIGAWDAVFNVLGFLGVITNATLVTFVGKQLAAGGPLGEEALGGLDARLENWRLWCVATCCTHSAFPFYL